MEHDPWRDKLPALRGFLRYRMKQPAQPVPAPPGLDRVLWMRLEETKIRFDAGNQLALLDAMRLCGKLGCPPPDWLVSASEAMLRERLLRKASDAAPGRNNSR